MSNWAYREDPRRLLFVLSRYKFAAKMLRGRQRVLEVGCGDAFATRLVQQEVPHVTAIDFDPIFIDDARERRDEKWPLDSRVHDILAGPVEPPEGGFDGAYALDVLEHIPVEHEDAFVRNIALSLVRESVAIIGTPSLASHAHASAESRAGHVNCKDEPGLRELLARYFAHVFVFSMNDEVVHTGYYPMANYLMALCCSRRDPAAGGGAPRPKADPVRRGARAR